MTAHLWHLDHDAGALDEAARAWRDLARDVGRAAEEIDQGAREVRDVGWEGVAAETYDGHRRRVVASLDRAEQAAFGMQSTLIWMAASLRHAEARLQDAWWTLSGLPVSIGAGGVVFGALTPEQQVLVDAATTSAQETRSRLDVALDKDVATLRGHRTEWQQVGGAWTLVADGVLPPFRAPVRDDTDGVGVIEVDGRIYVDTGTSGVEDIVRYTVGADGRQYVEIDRRTYVLEAGHPVVVRTGGGEDIVTVEVAPDEGGPTVYAGAGDDRVTVADGGATVLGLGGDDEIVGGDGNNRISAGAGDDYVDSGAGDDVVHGGAGEDVLYGMGGDDVLDGGTGSDYVEGADGSDVVVGGSGDDVVSGGTGDDSLDGGSGADVLYAGAGADRIHAGSGVDASYAETGDVSDAETATPVTVAPSHPFVVVDGSDEYVARVEADLALLGSSPAGQQLLAELQRAYDESGGAATVTIADSTMHTPNYEYHREAGASDVTYLPDYTVPHHNAPPVVALYHELAHAYDYHQGTVVPGSYAGEATEDHGVDVSERQATGLPIDHDGDPSTPEVIDPDHPLVLTENGVRTEMGIPTRDRYSTP